MQHTMWRFTCDPAEPRPLLPVGCICCVGILLNSTLLLLWGVLCPVLQAVTFLKRIKEVVEDPRRLLLDV